MGQGRAGQDGEGRGGRVADERLPLPHLQNTTSSPLANRPVSLSAQMSPLPYAVFASLLSDKDEI